MTTFRFRIAGVSFEGRQEMLKKLASFLEPGGFENIAVQLVSEPDNVYDANAIKVIFGDMHLGYVPKNRTWQFAGDEDGLIVSLHGEFPRLGATVEVEMEDD